MHHVYHRKLKGDIESRMKKQETIKNDQANLKEKKKANKICRNEKSVIIEIRQTLD